MLHRCIRQTKLSGLMLGIMLKHLDGSVLYVFIPSTHFCLEMWSPLHFVLALLCCRRLCQVDLRSRRSAWHAVGQLHEEELLPAGQAEILQQLYQRRLL